MTSDSISIVVVLTANGELLTQLRENEENVGANCRSAVSAGAPTNAMANDQETQRKKFSYVASNHASEREGSCEILIASRAESRARSDRSFFETSFARLAETLNE
jgi:hypothetical protein